jgi:hypothetical protein
MKYRTLINRNHAVAGVIEALLLIALVAIILSTIQLIYIPQIMEQRESDHMDEVANQFSFLKSVMDLQSMIKEDVPISSSLKLGSRELPYFVTARSGGYLQVYDLAYVDEWNISVDYGAKLFPLTSIKYQAYNVYFVPQTYVLEGGAIILKQPNGETMMVEPSITIENKTTEMNIYYEIPIIVGIPGKNATSGFKNCFIRTNYSHSEDNWQTDLEDAQSINISTDYPTAWYNLLNVSLEDNVNYEQGLSYVKITKKTKTINFYYKRVYIYAQISPGWIK